MIGAERGWRGSCRWEMEVGVERGMDKEVERGLEMRADEGENL